MRRLSLLLFLVCAIGQAQIEKTIKTDISTLAEIINTKNANAFYGFLADAKDLKKIFAASNVTDYNKIKSRYGQHLSLQPKKLFAELDKKLSKYKKRPTLKPHVVLYEKADMDAEKKTFMTIFFKDTNGSLYSMELKSIKVGNEIFYAYKGEIEKLQQKGLDNFKKNIIPLIANNTSELAILTFNKK